MPLCKNILSDSDALEVMALCERKQQIINEIEANNLSNFALKKELLELSDAEIGKDYNCKAGVIFGIRNGKTYKHITENIGKTKSGHQDILPTPSGKNKIVIEGKHIGVLKDVNLCVIVRDEYRAKNNLPKAAY